MVEKLDRFEMVFAKPELRYYLALNPNLTSEQVQRILDDSPNEHTKRGLAQYSKLTERQFGYLETATPASPYQREFSKNPNLTSRQIDRVIAWGKKGGNLHDNLALNAKLSDEQFKRIDHKKTRWNLTNNKQLTTEQIDSLYEDALKDASETDRDYLAQNPKLTEKQFERFWVGDEDYKKGSYPIGQGHQSYLSDNPHLTEDQIDRLMKHPDADKEGLSQYPKLTDEQFDELWNEEYGENDEIHSHHYRGYLAKNPNITPDQIDRLYRSGKKDNATHIRLWNLFQHSQLTDAQFQQFFDEIIEDVKPQQYLAQNPSINPEPKEEKDWFAKMGIINWMW